MKATVVHFPMGQFLRQVSTRSGVSGMTPRKARMMLRAIFTEMAEALRKGNRIVLPNFGTFRARPQKARTVSNPLTGGKVVQVAPTVRVTFRMARAWRNELNAGMEDEVE